MPQNRPLSKVNCTRLVYTPERRPTGFANFFPLRLIALALGLTLASTMSTLAACTFTLSRTVQPSGYYGATAYVTVTASASTCYWTATSNASWLHTSSSATGSGTVTYTIDNNY